MSPGAPEAERLTLAQLKRVADTTPQRYGVHVQVDTVTQKPTQQGKTYLDLRLSDGGENLTWRVFDGVPWFLEAAEVHKGDWLEITADWVDTGRYGIEPRNVSLRTLRDDEVQQLLAGDPATRERQQADYDGLTASVRGMADPRLRGLCQLFLQLHGERFRRAAAARDFHHARRGGLVEHVSQMMRCAVKIAEAYPLLNRDLLIAGVLFHDCGKLWENNYAEQGFTMPYSLHGELMGHIALGLEVVNKLWRQLMESADAAMWATLDPPNELVRLHLLHLIGSHHGSYEFGSPVLPKTPEAIVLHHVDNIDAKMEMFRRAYETSSELGPGIFEKLRPLPANAIRPLLSMTKPLEDEDARVREDEAPLA